MLADIGTKPLTPAVHKQIKYWITGQRFIVLLDEEHTKNLELQFHEMEYHNVLKIVNEINSSKNETLENK